jgi:hypothetical protein
MANKAVQTFVFSHRKILYDKSVNIYKTKGSRCEYFKYKKSYHLVKNYKKVKNVKSVKTRGGGSDFGNCVCGDDITSEDDGIPACPSISKKCSLKVCSLECLKIIHKRYTNTQRKCLQCKQPAELQDIIKIQKQIDDENIKLNQNDEETPNQNDEDDEYLEAMLFSSVINEEQTSTTRPANQRTNYVYPDPRIAQVNRAKERKAKNNRLKAILDKIREQNREEAIPARTMRNIFRYGIKPP